MSNYYKTPTYYSYISMMQSCTNPNAEFYENYGGRGITVCERWRTFKNFIEDMGIRPEGMCLDRIDNNGNYEPGNCKWSTMQEQQRNRGNFNVHVMYKGAKMLLCELAELVGINQKLL